MQEDREPAYPDTEDTSKVQKAVEAGLDEYLGAGAAGASEEEAFNKALGRAVERYLDSLEGEERIRVLLGLHRPGVRIPEERLLPESPEGREKALEAAAKLHAAGKLRRVRSRKDGRIFWVRVAKVNE
ncbi:MAG: hypothetical protein ACFB50_14600 [Rubrobacteraceae bacterium]